MKPFPEPEHQPGAIAFHGVKRESLRCCAKNFALIIGSGQATGVIIPWCYVTGLL
jgi:hypothetical protein